MRRVTNGEHTASIASESGFLSPNTVWNAPENAELRQKRPDMNLLALGDEIFVPELDPAVFTGGSNQEHSFTVTRSRVELRVTFLDLAGKPLAGKSLVIEDDDGHQEVTTDGDGLLILEVSSRERRVDVFEPDPESGKSRLFATLDVGMLDPNDEDLGPRERLVNLGYIADDSEFGGDLELELAIEEFQADQKLPVTGTLDDATKAALETAHGS